MPLSAEGHRAVSYTRPFYGVKDAGRNRGPRGGGGSGRVVPPSVRRAV